MFTSSGRTGHDFKLKLILDKCPPTAKLPENTQPSCRNVFPMGVSEPRVEVSTGPAVISTGISSLTPEIYKAINKLFNKSRRSHFLVFKGALF